MVVYVPFLQPFFDTVPLTLDDWLMMLPFFFASAIAMELLKALFPPPLGQARGEPTALVARSRRARSRQRQEAMP